MCVYTYIYAHTYLHVYMYEFPGTHPYAYVFHVQPIADRVAQNFEIVPKTFPTNQNSAHGIYN